MKKRLWSILLTLALCLTLLPTAAFAEETPSFGGGTGTQEDPWLITSREDLIALAEFLNSGDAKNFDAEDAGIGNCHGYYFKQTADIDLEGVAWEPIGYYSDNTYFSGNYDGDGHYIVNATSTGKQDTEGVGSAGIFGCVFNGSVKNLHVKKADFSATGIKGNYSFVGGIAGVCYIASITNCSVVDSSLKSITEWQNNCAGSIAGYSAGGTFDKCAAEGNNVSSNCYSGGLIGELDDDNEGASQSAFSNCYVADCTVISKTVNTGGYSFVGGFVGEGTSEILNIENCYVYRTVISTEGTATSEKLSGTGVFCGNFYFENICKINATNCFYGKCEVTKYAGTALEKTEEEFANGAVAKLLGDAFAQVGDYPKFNGPADYSSVDAAIAKANALKKNDYKDFSAVEAAINAVIRGKMLAEQAEVDAMAKAIEDAIVALQYKDADYTKVDAAIAKANALNKDEYKDFSAVEAAVKAVVRGKNITEQSEVDAMAKAIEDAIAALQYKDADYTKVDAAIAKANALNKNDYKDFSAVEAAVKAVVRGKNITEQSEVDAMAKAIEDAINALVRKSSGGGSSSPSYAITVPDKTEHGTVTANRRYAERGDTVTITVTPDNGYVLETVTATDKNGNTLKLTDKGDGKYTFTMPGSKVEIKATFMEDNSVLNFFYDVPNDAYYYEAVKWAVENGVTGGVGNNLFAPDGTCSRAQAVTFLWRAAGSPAPKSTATPFTDVPAGSYYYNAVLWAIENGITVGTSATTFSPDADCTRAQIVTFLWRAEKSPAAGSSNPFTDVASGAYYADAVLWAVKENITNGSTATTFSPDANCTRAQIVTFLYRCMK